MLFKLFSLEVSSQGEIMDEISEVRRGKMLDYQCSLLYFRQAFGAASSRIVLSRCVNRSSSHERNIRVAQR
ncbi:unnamed protein product [Boreogadus saida]